MIRADAQTIYVISLIVGCQAYNQAHLKGTAYGFQF